MATQAKQLAAPSQKGIVHIRTEISFGGDKVQMTSHGCECFLKYRDQETTCCSCFATRVKEIKVIRCETTVVGLNEKLKHNIILADLKKKLRCNGNLEMKKEAGIVIRLETGRTEEVKQFLCQRGLAAEDKIYCTTSPSV